VEEFLAFCQKQLYFLQGAKSDILQSKVIFAPLGQVIFSLAGKLWKKLKIEIASSR